MRRIVIPTRWMVLLLLVASMSACRKSDDTSDSVGWELKPPAADSESVAAKEQMQGIYPVGSQVKDSEALGGFGPCDNYPKELGDKDWGVKGKISLVAFPDEPVAYFKYRGIAVRVINRTSEVIPFKASDSCLYLVGEAKDENGRWQPIESLPVTFCGNSFHRVFLKPNQYWQFPARLYSGSIKTTIRFRLDHAENENSIYSNEFEGHVGAVQFEARGRGE